MMLMTASTAMGAKSDEYWDTIFEFREVLAARNRDSRSDKSSLVDMAVRYSTDFVAARWNDSAMVVGWIP